MNVLGSVFLGDAQRQRILSSPSTPPTSPTSHLHSFPQRFGSMSSSTTSPMAMVHPPPPINPEMSLQLRIRWLEALLLGVKQDVKDKNGKATENGKHVSESDTLVRRAEEIKKRIDNIVEANEGLRKFMNRYDQHAHLLTPSFALSGTSSPPSYSSMTSQELDAFLLEMEPEIRAVDRDLREIETLEKKGVLGAGKLTEYEALLPRLHTLVDAHEQDLKTAAALEKRVAAILEQYANRVDALSELFVEWNDVLNDAEDKVSKLERERDEKRRLGYE